MNGHVGTDGAIVCVFCESLGPPAHPLVQRTTQGKLFCNRVVRRPIPWSAGPERRGEEHREPPIGRNRRYAYLIHTFLTCV